LAIALTAIGIVLIVIGVAHVSGGLILWHRASRTDSTDPDDAGELRAIINALEEADRAERTPAL
jgi:hypothetical protein